MKCPYCGADAAANFCGVCGARIDRAENMNVLDNSSYGETRPYRTKKKMARGAYGAGPAEVRPSSGRLMNFANRIVLLFTAALAVLQLFLPASKWVIFRWQIFGRQISGGKLSLFDLGWKFITQDNIVTFMTGLSSDFGLSEHLPDAVNRRFAEGRSEALVLLAVFAAGMLFNVLFVFFALFRRRIAPFAGAFAAFLNNSGSIAAVKAVETLNSVVSRYDVFSWKNISFSLGSAPYLSIALSAAIFVFCTVAAVLGFKSRRCSV